MTNEAKLPTTLIDLLNNSLVLSQTAPYIGLKSILHLMATCRALRHAILENGSVFRRVDLSGLKADNTRSWFPADIEPQFLGFMPPLLQAMESFHKYGLLSQIATLILDRQPISVTIAWTILKDPSYNIRLLSIKEVRGFMFDEFFKLVRYLIRPSRPRQTPKLKGLYFFLDHHHYEAWNEREDQAQATRNTPTNSITNVPGAQLGVSSGMHEQNGWSRGFKNDAWYGHRGEVCGRRGADPAAADLLEACEGLIAFDATICRHSRELYNDPRPKIATVRLDGCASCGSCPEGPACPGKSPESHLPLVSPPPLHSATVKAAQSLDTSMTGGSHPEFIARCEFCLTDRWCSNCNVWWCEDCYSSPHAKANVEGLSSLSAMPMASYAAMKVHNGLCVERCLVKELLRKGGEGGMWG